MANIEGKRPEPLSHAETKSIRRLVSSHEWLRAKEKPLADLLSKQCGSDDERNLLEILLTKLKYVYAVEYASAIRNLARVIAKDWRLNPAKTLVVASTADSEPDSGQQVLQIMKRLFAELGWIGCAMRNRYDRAWKKDYVRENIVIVDEFSGTGDTMVGRINTIRREYKLNKYAEPNFFVALVASMSDGVSSISDAGVECHCEITLSKGISDHFVDDDLASAMANMSQLEATLSPEYKGEDLPNFGHGRAEALFGGDICNTPNSVFPIFWWPALLDGTLRTPVLWRG